MKGLLLSLLIVSLLFSSLFAFNSSSFSQKRYNEAPILTELVKQGKLPPVEQRLPETPAIVNPIEEIGQYGGTWRRAYTGPADQSGIDRAIGYVRLVRWDLTGRKIIPDLARKYEMSKDGKEFTFWLRKGLKWSDGEPFTTDDIIFWHEDIIMNKELTPTYPNWLIAKDKPAEIKKIDAYTFKIVFDAPFPLFPMMHATQGGFIAPKHYLQQFHPKYASKEKIDVLTKEAGFQNWYQLFAFKNNWTQNPDLPVLTAWRLTRESTKEALIFERNPYYYKIDTSGNQLPYIDRVMNVLVESPEVINMKLLAGEFDMQERHTRPFNYTLFMENRDKGNYRVLKWISGVGADPLICLNLSVKDPVKRKLFQDVRFRKALSLAINRNEINSICYLGLGKPMQASIPSGMPYYDASWEKTYAEYNPSLANRLLNEVGLARRDKDGFRMSPDGKTLELTIEFTTDFPGVTTSDVLEMISHYWRSVGLKVALKPEERRLYSTRCSAGEVEIGIWYLDWIGNFLANPQRLLGTDPQSPWAVAYARWYQTGGKSGEEPPQELKRLYDTWDKIKVAVDSQERNRLIKEFISIHRKNLWLIGTVGAIPQIVIVKNSFRNVPEKLIWDSAFRTPSNAFPEQFFFKK